MEFNMIEHNQEEATKAHLKLKIIQPEGKLKVSVTDVFIERFLLIKWHFTL